MDRVIKISFDSGQKVSSQIKHNISKAVWAIQGFAN